MTRNEIITQLKEINTGNKAVEIYILAQPEVDANNMLQLSFYKARMAANLPPSIINLFYPVIKKKLIDKEYDVAEYDPALTPDRTVIWEQSSENVLFYNYFHNLIETTEQIRRYSTNRLAYVDIWAYWIKVYGNGNSFYIIKKVTSSKLIQTGGKLAIIFEGDILKNLETDILTMDGTFDAIYFNNTLLFENKQNFEKALLYKERKQKVAVETLNAISGIGFVEDFDRVKEFLKDDYHSINKLNKLKEKPYFQNLNFAKCKKIIEDYNVEIEIDEDNDRFNITSKTQAKHFIKVLNDDYLLSEMTAIKYAANSKENT
jgi:hypothetical protein